MTQQLALIQSTETPEIEATNYAPKEVAFVKPFEQQLQLIEGEFSKFVFDYSNPDDNEKARSLIRKLQKSRAAIERVAKAERDPAISYQRHVIDEEKKLTMRVQKLIDQYEEPLKEWGEKEKLRQEGIRDKIAKIRPTAEFVLAASASSLKSHLSLVETLDTDRGFDEFSAEAFAARITTIEYLKEHIIVAEKREADAARLAQLEAEAEARRLDDERIAAEKAEAERIAREVADAAAAEEKRKAGAAAEAQRIADAEKQAAEDARIAAEAKAAQREVKLLQDAENARIAQKAAEDKAVADAEAAEAQRIADAEEAQRRQDAAVAAETKRIADEAAAQKAIDDARAADREHRAKINREVLVALTEVIGTAISPEEQGKAIITAVALGKIPHISISY